MKKIISALLFVSLILHSRCGPIISNINVEKIDYNNIKDVNEIKVLTKDNKHYRFKEFEFTDSHIIGQKFRFNPNGWEKSQIALIDVQLIVIYGAYDIYGKEISNSELKKSISTYNRYLLGFLGYTIGGFYGIFGLRSLGSPIATGWIGGVSLGFAGYKMGMKLDKQNGVENIHKRQKSIDKE